MPAERAGDSRPRLLLFDVNETLLDLAPLRASVGRALGGREDLLPLWFTSLLHHSLVTTVGDRFRGFDEIGAATLTMIARSRGIELDEDGARRATEVMLSLPPHADVEPALRTLKAAGVRMATLTNSTRQGVVAQMASAGLAGYFDALMSVEEPGMYKPHGHVYRWAARRMGVPESRCMMVAAHGWDVAGAAWAGLRAAFLARPGQVLYPLGPQPEIVEADLGAVAGRILELAEAPA